uniref:Uncharacterized protein n=1 Tax=Romanomermis culicivorax TaxID=13658 RepID=A0A915KM26_ROMCU
MAPPPPWPMPPMMPPFPMFPIGGPAPPPPPPPLSSSNGDNSSKDQAHLFMPPPPPPPPSESPVTVVMRIAITARNEQLTENDFVGDGHTLSHGCEKIAKVDAFCVDADFHRRRA